MARIVLDPGESFEHFHSLSSRSTVESGVVEFSVSGEVSVLGPGMTKHIPPNTLHTMKNLSPDDAVMSCGHAPLPGT